MKSVLYVGATLMIGAGIYGFVDYNKTSRHKEFKNLYTEKKVIVPDLVNANRITEPVDEKEDKKFTAKTAGTKNTIVKNNSLKNKKSNGSIKKKRTFNPKMFSRGGLDERLIAPKEEIKKTEIKEQ
jgi:hypothetical protein